MPRLKAKRYSNVEMSFVSMDDALTESATVISRAGEMVIEISDGQRISYLVIGKLRGQSYFGTNSAFGDVPRVKASWTQLSGKYIGRWIEDEEEYLFSFTLSDD